MRSDLRTMSIETVLIAIIQTVLCAIIETLLVAIIKTLLVAIIETVLAISYPEVDRCRLDAFNDS